MRRRLTVTELAIRQPPSRYRYSPLESAVLGCRAGESVEVNAPAGRRLVTVLSVNEPVVCSS